MTPKEDLDARMDAVIQRGSRVRAEWFEAHFGEASLAGAQMKTTATAREIIGTVRHIRSNDPNFAPENAVIFVEPDDGSGSRTSSNPTALWSQTSNLT